MTVRTRFAPSPTGFIHLGNIRSGLYPWAFARATGGKFILRIEDTDLERSTRQSVDAILDSMKWLGLDWDEGPFFQMQRLARYKEVAEQLVASGHAYRDYMPKEELDKLPAEMTKYMVPSAGTFNCRAVAGTNRMSAHGLGIAIDIATTHADYWYWNRPGRDGRYPHRNRIPWEIVEVFERHGFVWGGKWYHYDTMHFEYRPEILAAAKK